MTEQPKQLDHKQWAMFCHLSALAGVIIPFGSIVAPLTLWLVKKDEHPFIDEQGKEVVNFQIFIGICGIGFWLLMAIVPFIFNGITIGVFPIIGLVIFIFSLLGALKAKEGISFKYPTPFRFL